MSTLRVSPDFRPSDGIYRSDALGIMNDAELAAQRLRQLAQIEAEEIASRAHAETALAIKVLESEAIQRIGQATDALESQYAVFFERAEEMIMDLAASLFERLVLELPDRDRLASSFKRLVQESPHKPKQAQLRVHPLDLAYLPETEWEIKADPEMTSGSCRLEAANGVWSVDFSTAVAELKSALQQSRVRSDSDATLESTKNS